MKTSNALLLLTPLLAATTAAQSQTVHFSDPSGLEAEAEFTLLGGGTALEVRLRNLSTGVPAGFSNSDQLITGISWDFDEPGDNATDTLILAGSVLTGPASLSLNFDVMDVGANADVSGEYGFGNGGSTGTRPNFVSAHAAGSTPFGGPNLDGPTNLGGPQAGLVPAVPLVDLGGLGAIQDEIVATVLLDRAVVDLSFLEENGTILEFGSDAAFLTGCPDCDEDASIVQVDDPAGLNLSGGLAATPGSLPTLGNPNWCLDMDDAAGQCVTPGSLSAVFVSAGTANLSIPGWGCAPGSAGVILIDPTMAGMISGPIVWAGPGMPATHCFAIPNDPAICGLVCFGQGVFLDRQGASRPGVLTNRVDATVGN